MRSLSVEILCTPGPGKLCPTPNIRPRYTVLGVVMLFAALAMRLTAKLIPGELLVRARAQTCDDCPSFGQNAWVCRLDTVRACRARAPNLCAFV